jgi:hypothetical protein
LTHEPERHQPSTDAGEWSGTKMALALVVSLVLVTAYWFVTVGPAGGTAEPSRYVDPYIDPPPAVEFRG